MGDFSDFGTDASRELEELLSRGQTVLADLNTQLETQQLQIEDLAHENRQLAGRIVEVDRQNNDLVKLYVASDQLHSTLELEPVLKILSEIVIDVIGAERFAVLLANRSSQQLEPVLAEGEGLEGLPSFSPGDGVIGSALVSPRAHFGTPTRTMDVSNPLACIPLWVQSEPVGALVIYQLLRQKDGFSAVDFELFTLLARHAASALYAARIFTSSERKLNTIRGMLDLLSE